MSFDIYASVHFLLVCSSIQLFKSSSFHFKLLANGILGIATLESLYCISQYFGLLESQNKLFFVTGSWANPNVTGLFLALTSPFFYYYFYTKSKKIYFIGFGIVLIALSLLKCRAAFIGTVVAAIVFFGLEYNFINWARDKKNRLAIKGLIILSLMILIPVANQLYNSKKASSDGRKFIWKLSAQMVAEKPVLGYGYGLFEKEYNLFQSQYIEKGKADAAEMQNADYVLVPHNEILHNAVEGGLVGLLLLSLFLGSLLVSIKSTKSLVPSTESLVESSKSKVDSLKSNEVSESLENLKNKNRIFNLAYAGVIAFVVMSMVNFAIQCIPVMTMLSLYTAVICSQLKPVSLSLIPINNNKFGLIVKITGTAISIILLYSLVYIAIADRQNKIASLLLSTKKYPQALKILKTIEPELNQYSDYWKNIGMVYFETNHYSDAIASFNKAKTTSSNPELYLITGICYDKLGQSSKTIDQFRQLVLAKPSKFLYRFLLMQAYEKNNDMLNAQNTAQGILDLPPKIPSREVDYYKMMARKVVSR